MFSLFPSHIHVIEGDLQNIYLNKGSSYVSVHDTNMYAYVDAYLYAGRGIATIEATEAVASPKKLLPN